MRPVILLLFVLALPLSAQSKDTAKPAPASGFTIEPGFRFTTEAVFEGGGDRILRVTSTDGSTQDIYAGQGGTFGFGFEFRPAAAPRLALGASLGYKFVTTAADDADIKFTRVPLELTARWSLNQDWWIGGGIVRHSSIEFDGDGFVADVSLPDAQGLTGELGWRWIALTATSLDYDNGGGDLNAGSVGVSFRWVFGTRR